MHYLSASLAVGTGLTHIEVHCITLARLCISEFSLKVDTVAVRNTS